MSSKEVVVRLADVGKQYKIFKRPIDRLKHALFGEEAADFQAFEALRGVNLELHRGETLGVVGSNGAGKSTLLQIVCGTLEADSGSVEVHGRISALLELGASFNPQFTGRENVRINGLLMGYTVEELALKMDEIIEFADIGEFVDQPVRTYSSGMFARLAFAVAINLAPDILIVDEALAVGDEAFQRKCFAQLEKLKDAGVSIMLVSHSARSIIELCDRAAMLYKGECLLVSDAKTTVTEYQRLIYSSPSNHGKVLENIRAKMLATEGHSIETLSEEAAPADAPEAEEPCDDRDDWFDPGLKPVSTEVYPERGAIIDDVQILTADLDKQVNVLRPNSEYCFCYRVRFLDDATAVRFAMTIKSTTGLNLGAQWSAARDAGLASARKGAIAHVRLPFRTVLTPGTYFINAGLHGSVDEESVVMHRIIDALAFRIRAVGKSRLDAYVDISATPPTVEFENSTADAP